MAGQREAVAQELSVQSSERTSLWQQLILWGKLVRFSHTIFALPFALSMVVFLLRDHSVSWVQLGLLIAALVSARTAAMCFNRLVDRHIDAKNQRTARREIPAGAVSVTSAKLLFAASALMFFIASALLGMHCLVLAPLVLALLVGYSLTKRFTSASHFVLGVALACAPGGVWYAITAQFAWLPVWMMAGVLFWVSGFDILYSLQDRDFDRASGLYSIPAKFGVERALLISRFVHGCSLVFFFVFGYAAGLGGAYWIALAFFGVALVSQHLTISSSRLDKIENAFFTRNAWASVIYLVGMVVDVGWGV